MNQYQKLKKWVERKKIQKRLNKSMVLWVVLIVIISIGLLNTDLSNVLGISTQKTEPPSIFLTPTEYQFPTNTPTPTVYIAPTADPDPIVTCNISKECGGGSLQLRSSICSNSTCCGFYNGKWIFYESKAKCTQDQNTESTNARKSNYVPLQETTQINTEPLITCVLSWGTYQLSQSSCDNFKKSDKPSEPSVTCVLSYGTFQLTQSSCDSFKSTDKPYVPSNNTQTIVTPALEVQQNNSAVLNQQCKDNAVQAYNSAVQSANAGYGGGSSAGDAMRQIAKSQYDSAVNACNQQYPI